MFFDFFERRNDVPVYALPIQLFFFVRRRVFVKSVAVRCDFRVQNTLKCLSGRGLPRTPLGSLQRSPKTLARGGFTPISTVFRETVTMFWGIFMQFLFIEKSGRKYRLSVCLYTVCPVCQSVQVVSRVGFILQLLALTSFLYM